MSKTSVLYCIVAFVVILSFASCSNAFLSPSMTDTVSTSDLSEKTNKISEDRVVASVDILEDIVNMIYVTKDTLNVSFLMRSDGYQSNIVVIFYSENIAVFSAEGVVCLTIKDSQGNWRYYLLNCYYFGDGDYRFIANKNGSYVAMSNLNNQILILNVETKKVSLLRFETGENVSLISWDSDVLYFKCQSSSVPAYAYDAKTYSIISISQKDQIPGSTNDLKEYDYKKILNEIFDIK